MLLLRTPRARVLLPSLLLLAGSLTAGFALHRIAHALTADHARSGRTDRKPVLVELFTSEGCSSCPPADALLAQIQREQPVAAAEILALEEHVDYWDGLGWHDRFSAHDITDRQSAYVRRFNLDSNYTPQMVVDGAAQFPGVNKAQALQAIAHAAQTPKLALSLQALLLKGTRVNGQVGLPPSIPSGTELFTALVQPTATTSVMRGENGGHTLNHVSVVRALRRIPLNHPGPQADFALDIPKDLIGGETRVVVFLQSKDQGLILAAASSPLPADPVQPKQKP